MDTYISRIADKIIDVGADVTICNEDGNCRLHLTLINRDKEDFEDYFLRNLLSRCINNEVNAQNIEVKTALLLACEKRDYTFVKLLVEHGAEADILDKYWN